jgi:hypothetical protein
LTRAYTVQVNQAALPHVDGQVVPLVVGEAEPSMQIAHSKWTDRLPRQLNDAELDWLHLVDVLYTVDRACRRGDGLDWGRSIRVSMKLRQPDHWRAHIHRLQEIFGDLTGDTLRLHVEDYPEPPPAPRTRRVQFEDFDCVALLSGGVDSFCGGLQLLEANRSPLFLSQSLGGAGGHAQSKCRDYLENKGARLFTSFSVTPKRQAPIAFPNPPENSERCRTLLYVGVALLIASVCDQDSVFLNENGIMALHAPIAEARAGGYSTKTAAPSIMQAISEVFSAGVGASVAVENLLIGSTKAEVVKWVADHGVPAELTDTVSCWRINRPGPHCGECIPCIIRTVAFRWAGVADVNYALDVFGAGAALGPRAQDNLGHFLGYAHDLATLGDGELEARYGDIIEVEGGMTPQVSLDMHRRWGTQVETVIRQIPHLAAGWDAV